MPPWTTLDHAIERSKSEILGDVAEGIIPATCASYSELHDYVDANGYAALSNMISTTKRRISGTPFKMPLTLGLKPVG